MLFVYWAKLCFDVGNAAEAEFEYEGIIPIKELQLNMSNKFDLL